MRRSGNVRLLPALVVYKVVRSDLAILCVLFVPVFGLENLRLVDERAVVAQNAFVDLERRRLRARARARGHAVAHTERTLGWMRQGGLATSGYNGGDHVIRRFRGFELSTVRLQLVSDHDHNDVQLRKRPVLPEV